MMSAETTRQIAKDSQKIREKQAQLYIEKHPKLKIKIQKEIENAAKQGKFNTKIYLPLPPHMWSEITSELANILKNEGYIAYSHFAYKGHWGKVNACLEVYWK